MMLCAMTVRSPNSLWICYINDTLILTYPVGWYTFSALSVNSQFLFLSYMESSQRRTKEWMKNVHTMQKWFPGYACRTLLEEDGQWDSVSSVVSKCDKSKISTYFPRHSISFVFRSSQQAICIGLHASQAPCLPSTDQDFLPQDPCRSARPWSQTTRLPNTNGSV